MSVLLASLVLLTLVAVAGALSRFLPALPLPLLLMALGAACGGWSQGFPLVLEPQVFMLLFIPPLLFADGWSISKRELGLQSLPLLLLSVGMVLLSVVVVGFGITYLLPGMPRPLAYLLSAALSPTDAVATTAMARRHRLPDRMQRMLEGESLMNDASGLVAVKFALLASMAHRVTGGAALMDLLWMALGGGAVGLVCAGVAHALQAALLRGREHAVEMPAILLLLLAPFPPYLLAEHWGLSGVLAAVAAGMGASLLAVRRSVFNASHVQTQAIAGMLRHVFDGLVFLLLGLQLSRVVQALPEQLNLLSSPGSPQALRLWGTGLAIALLLLAVRFAGFVVVGRWGSQWLARWRRRTSAPLSFWLAGIGAMGGVRGALSLVAVLGVPLTLANGDAFPFRGLLVFMAGLAIVLSLGFAAVALPFLLRHEARCVRRDERHVARERCWARRRGARAALHMLSIAAPRPGAPDHEAAVHVAACARIEHGYRQRLLLDTPGAAGHHLLALEWQLRLRLLQAERNELQQLRLRNRINDDTLRALAHELDLVESVLRHQPLEPVGPG